MKKVVSIVICTLNREDVLCNTLRQAAMLVSRRRDTELIVVDQTLHHIAATDVCLGELAQNMQLYRVEFASLTRARNYGISRATGEIILFLDDDVEPSPNLIEEHLSCYTDKAVWGVGGGVLLPGKRKLSKQDLTPKELHNLEKWRTNRFDLDWRRTMLWAPGCNMSFRRQKLLEVGGFDEAFYGMAIGEETELCYRLHKAGGVIQYAPAAELVHLVNPEGGCRDARAEEERIAQLMDNSLYMMRRIGHSWLKCAFILLHQCRSIVLNWKSLREWTWARRCGWCFKGLSRAVRGLGRQPVLPFKGG